MDAGMWREGGSLEEASGLFFRGARGDAHAPIFCLRTCSTSPLIALAMIFATSPSGIWWRSRDRSSSSSL
jgi:hypothetical protein